jgi:DNA-binding NarL/FixJ family response regulator
MFAHLHPAHVCGRAIVVMKKVAIVEDDAGLREQLTQILGAATEVEFVGACGSGEEAVDRIHVLQPDVVLMDIRLPGMSGIECVAHLKRALPSLQIIMLTVYEDSERIFRALKTGADGYLVKSSPPNVLLGAIKDVGRGGSPMSSHIARKVVRHFHAVGPSPETTENLSPREQEVLNLLSAGYLYKEISDQLGIGTETVRTYVKHICEKMHVRNRVEAVAKHGGKMI